MGNPFALWSVGVGFFLSLVAAIYLGGYSAIVALVNGEVPNTVGFVAVSIPIFGLVYGFCLQLSNTKSFSNVIHRQSSLEDFLFLPIVEEIVCRWFLLDILTTRHALLTATIRCPDVFLPFILLMSIWGFVSCDSLLSSFCRIPAIIILAVIYLHGGLLASIVVHIGGLSLLLLYDRVEDSFLDKDFCVGGYCLLMTLLGASIWRCDSDIVSWFHEDNKTLISSFCMSVVILFGLRLCIIAAALDYGTVTSKGNSGPLPPVPTIAFLICLLSAVMALISLFCWLLPQGVILLALVYCVIKNSDSGSSKVHDLLVGIAVCTISGLLAVHGPVIFLLWGLYIPVFIMERRYV